MRWGTKTPHARHAGAPEDRTGYPGSAIGHGDALAIPPEIGVESTVGIGAIPQGFGLEVELRIALPGLSHREAEALVQKAHVVCPYSNATRGNIAVRLVLVSSHA